MNQRGVDYASQDDNGPPDFKAAHDAGARFVYIRRSVCYFDAQHQAWRLAHDPCYARDAQRAREAHLVVGAYLAASYHEGAPSAEEQVANFLAAGGEIGKEDLPVALDVEFTGRGIQDTGRSQKEVFDLVLEFVCVLKRHFKTVAIYTSHVQWHDDNGLGGPDDASLRDVILWQKTPYRLKAGQPLDTQTSKEPHFGPSTSDPYSYWQIPRPWRTWWIQQTQGDCAGFPGFSSTADVNLFKTSSLEEPSDAAQTEWLQNKLGVPVTGVWGLWLHDAVRKFQSLNGLELDGVVGVATFASLCNL